IGLLHFLQPDPFVRIVPTALPVPRFFVFVSGSCEIACGVGLLLPRWRRAAAWSLVALYLAVFPANVNQALNHIQLFPDNPLPTWLSWLRLPFQALFIACAYWFTRADANSSSVDAGSR